MFDLYDLEREELIWLLESIRELVWEGDDDAEIVSEIRDKLPNEDGENWQEE